MIYGSYIELENQDADGNKYRFRLAQEPDGDITITEIDPQTGDKLRQLVDFEWAKRFELQLPERRVVSGDHNVPFISGQAHDARCWSGDAQYWAARDEVVPANGHRQCLQRVLTIPANMRLMLGRIEYHAKHGDLRWSIDVDGNAYTTDDYSGDKLLWTLIYDNSDNNSDKTVSITSLLVNVSNEDAIVDSRACYTVYFYFDWSPDIRNDNPA